MKEKIKIKKGDKVFVLKGKDRGKSGKVIKVMPSGNRLVVEGLNLLRKNIRAKRQGEKGQIVDVPAAVSAANVLLACSSCSKPVRVGYRLKGTSKERYCKKCKA